MKYFVSDIKKLYKSKPVQLVLLIMIVAAVGDPLQMRFVGKVSFSSDMGDDPFLYWLLMASSSIGHAVFFNLRRIIPVLTTGMVFWQEYRSSVYCLLISRGSRRRYLLSKASAVLIVTFVNIAVTLFLNLIVTWLCFPGNNGLTEQYQMRMPLSGTLAAVFFRISPFCMALFYVFLNALHIALYSLVSLSVQMIGKFKNRYLALFIPIIVLQIANFATGRMLMYTPMWNPSFVTQPITASMYTITGVHVVLSFGAAAMSAIVLFAIGMARNREAI